MNCCELFLFNSINVFDKHQDYFHMIKMSISIWWPIELIWVFTRAIYHHGIHDYTHVYIDIINFLVLVILYFRWRANSECEISSQITTMVFSLQLIVYSLQIKLPCYIFLIGSFKPIVFFIYGILLLIRRKGELKNLKVQVNNPRNNHLWTRNNMNTTEFHKCLISCNIKSDW